MNCPSCSAEIPAGFKFCGQCGKRLDEGRAAPRGSEPAAETAYAERRQLTVLFCDLVGSTALSERLDPEDLHGLVHEFQEACARAIEAFEGYIAQYLGDGLLIYFGYPTAHEDDAVRAVRAALAILEAIGSLGERLVDRGGEAISVRVGIHTGPVVAGEVGAGERREQLALGQTPNIAARLQGIAQPDTILVSQETYRLTQGFFNFEPLGSQLLKGVSQPLPVHQVLEESGIHGRFELVVRQGLKPLVGRRTELDLLLDRMERAREGRGCAVLVTGEAGIGKSRLIYSFRAIVKNEVASWWVYRGTPYTQNTSFYPVVELIHVQLRLEPDDSAEVKIAKMEESCDSFGLAPEIYVPLIARLLELPLGGRYPEQDDNPQLFKEKILDFFVEFILARTRHQPVVFLMEDLHWIDPSTLEFLDRLLDASAEARLLLLFTARPGFDSPWDERGDMTRLDLARLTPQEGEQLIHQLAHPQRLSADLMGHILAKTDGVPVYIEELTISILESGVLEATGDGELEASAEGLAIPASLRDSLTARLDRLGPAKEVAQIGSALGREFSYDLLMAVSGLVEAVLRDRLERLVRAELLFRRLEGQMELYTFKHALLQDAAHLSLVRARRQAIHGQIASILEGEFSGAAEAEPEQLAHHWEEARRLDDAVRCFLQAAGKAVQRSAYAESVSHCTRALDLLDELPESGERLERELEVRALLGVSLIASRGYAAPEVEANYARSQEVCRRIGDTPQLVPTLYGLWVYHLLRGHRESSIELADTIHAQARDDDPAQRLVGHSARGTTALYRGRFEEALWSQETAMALYQPELQSHLSQTFGDESGLLSHFYHFWGVWISGQPDAAVEFKDRAMALAESLRSPYVLATAMLFEMILHHELRQLDRTAQVAERFVTLSEEQRFPFFASLAHTGRGWVRSQTGDPEGGLEEIGQGLDLHQAIGTRLPRSYWLTYRIDALHTAGRSAEGLEVADEALELSSAQLDVFYDAELHRLRGELLTRLDRPDDAEAAFRHSLKIARDTGARSFELRTASSLARFLPDRSGEGAAEAREILETAYGRFSGGFDTRDLEDARALLDQLG